MTLNNLDGLPVLSSRDPAAHKGQHGKLLIVATSPGMTGAGVLCARAALRSGAGLVTLAVPAGLMPIVGASLTAAMSLALPETAQGELSAAAAGPILRALAGRNICAIGPGLGRRDETGVLLESLVAQIEAPLVLDADALYHLRPAWLDARSSPTVLTPHVGEMARLCGLSSAEIQADRVGLALRFAAEHRVVLLLKGQGTVITDGARAWVNPTGNPGMATAGAGDVLTGMVAALLGQGLGALEATRLAAYLHGLAGDLCAEAVGEISLIADDLVEWLPAAFQQLDLNRIK